MQSTSIEKSIHYNGEVAILFYPDSHRYKLEGEKTFLVGVTTATGMVDKSTPLMIWNEKLIRKFLMESLERGEPLSEGLIEMAVTLHSAKKEEAATSGTLVHEWAEKYIKGDKPDVPKDEAVRNGVLAFLKWVQKYQVKFISSEKRVYSRKYKYVGTMDCEFTMGAESHKIVHPGDFKTSSGVYMPMVFQVAGYQEAATEEFGTIYGDKWLLRFQKEDKEDKNGNIVQRAGEFEAKSFYASDHPVHFRGFLSCLELKEQSKAWEREHGIYAKKSYA